jgi:ribosomal protein S20
MRTRATLASIALWAFWALWLALPSTGTAAPASATAATARDDLERAGPVVPVGGPPIGAVLSAAYTAAGLDRDPGRSWILRARLGGLVPWVTVRTTRDTSWQDTQSEVGHGSTFEVRATWRLDRLVFDGRELQVAALEAARRRERRRLANRVIRSYFTWRRATEAALATEDERARTRMAEATAELDALTDGWFSDELARPQRGAGASQARRSAPP